MGHGKITGLMLSVVMVVGLWAAPSALGEEPRRGGIMNVALAADPPSLDMHQEQTFAVAQPLGPIYNTLIQFDPHNYPEIIGDLAKSWTVSDDYLTYTFTLHEGVKFHDGSPLTSADVKASWDKIVFPPEGVVSPKKHLDQDIHYYKNQTFGSGPFKMKNYVRGSVIELERNPNYWKKGLPYLEGIKYFIIRDDGARAKAIRAGRVDVELRFLPPGEVDAIKAQMGDKVVVAAPKNIGNFGVTFNVDKKPFDDERVRKALSLAIDRYDMVKTLRPFTILDAVGGMMHPDSQWALSEEELQRFPGFGKDYEANLKEAKRLMAEAGYPNGFQTVLTNRNIKLPYIDLGVYLISTWKKIGVEAEHKLEESATWSKSRVARDFELLIDPYGSATVGDPDEMLSKFTTRGSSNWGRFSDPVVDGLFEQQAREMDEQKRIQLVQQIDKRLLEKVWRIQGLWTNRLEVRSVKIRNYEPQPSHWMNRRFEDVWLAEK